MKEPNVCPVVGGLTTEGRAAILDYNNGLRKTSLLLAFPEDALAKSPMAGRYGPIPKKEEPPVEGGGSEEKSFCV
jgi:hypothetical protein